MSAADTITIYTDGSCLNNPGPGGWGAVVLPEQGEATRLSGHKPWTTNNRMELTAAIEGLEATPAGSTVALYSDSQYLVNTMTLNWKRRKNHDLWKRLDSLAGERVVIWHWIYGHAGDHWNHEADRLAVSAMKTTASGRPRARGGYGRQN